MYGFDDSSNSPDYLVPMEDVNLIISNLLVIQYVMEYMILMTMCIFPRDVLEALSTSWDNLLSKCRAIFLLFHHVVKILLLDFCALITTCLVVLMAQYMFHYRYALMPAGTFQKLYALICGTLLLVFLSPIKLSFHIEMMRASSYHLVTILTKWLIIWILIVTVVLMEVFYYPSQQQVCMYWVHTESLIVFAIVCITINFVYITYIHCKIIMPLGLL